MIDAPLECKLENDELVVRIGIRTLEFAAQRREPFTEYDNKLGDWRVYWRVIDPLEFAKDVKHELLREEEDGSSPLTNLLDLACTNALDQGSLGVEKAEAPPYPEEDNE